MNKKLFFSCLVLSISVMAVAPIYKQSNLNSNKTVHPITEWQALNLEKVSSIKQQLYTIDDSVTYPQAEENMVVLAATTSNKATSTNKSTTTTSTKTSTANKTTVASKSPTSTVKKAVAPVTTTKPKTITTSTSRTSTASRGTSIVSSSKANAVIATAKSLLGVPYVWGGVTPSGFDCSGFSQYVLEKNGISVPRTAAEQYKAGISVSKSNLRVGDLVFFTTYKAGPSHLGFYIGNGQFIHASSSKGVSISNLSNTYYSSRYIGARRVIN